MFEWSKLTDPEIDGLNRTLPVILPIGLIEAHGAHIESGLDAATASYFARRVCEQTDAILLPSISYGFADTTWEYAATLGVKAETLGMMIGDICMQLCHHGFNKVIVLSGHGGNGLGVHLGFNRAWAKYPELQPAYWTYYGISGVAMSHADETETSVAMAIGANVYMDRAVDFVMPKLWHEVSSRKVLAPTSGAVNGRPTLASLDKGQEAAEHIVRVLVEKVSGIIAETK
ncbi:MAG TPA: creatininase family protein [Devosiaceae bacterium]